MESIELKMAILTGFVGGRLLRLFAEICSIAFVVLIQPVIVSMLVMSALDNFNPKFSAH
ncbi:MAG TPA: hypothetical protein VIM35_00465 [Gallionella sp.]